jgi:hypothetical protein
MVIDQLKDLTLIDKGFPEHVWMRGSHGGREERQR